MLLYFIFLLFQNVYATSFTSFSVTRQVEDTPYIVRGIIGDTWVTMDEPTQKPYTYWNFTIRENLGAEKISEDRIIIREAGGEVGNIGYRIPSSAEFRAGEDVVVLLRNADHGDAKEIVGLMSGKYNIIPGKDGKEYLRNGLGTDLRDAQGKLLDMEKFRDLVVRAQTNRSTDEDHSVVVNPMHASHAGHPEEEEREKAVVAMQGLPKVINGSQKKIEPESSESKAAGEGQVEDVSREPASEKNFSWFSISVVVLFIFSVAFMLRLLFRKN